MLDEILATKRPLVLVTGAAGTGRTTLLARLSDRLSRQGRSVTAIRVTAGGDLLPVRFVVGEHAVRLPAPDRTGTPFAPAPGAAADPDLARRAATVIAGALPPNGLLVIDDAHWLDPDSLAVLHALVRGRTRCVCTARPAPAPAVLRELRAADLVEEFRLAPLPHRAVAREVTRMLTATPEPSLTDRVRELSHGLPAALKDSVEALRHNGSIHVMDRVAYLVRPSAPLVVPEDNQLVEAVRELGDDCWAVAKALSVLAPLGPAVPALLAEVCQVSEVDIQASLDRLRAAEVVHCGRTWRFVVPLIGAAVFAYLGPFERRQLSAAVVTAVWSNVDGSGSGCDIDAEYLTDRIADAGALVDPDRALHELLTRAAAVHEDGVAAALHWLTAAADLATDPHQHAEVLFMRTATCFALGDHHQCLSSAQRLLADYAGLLPPDVRQRLAAMATVALGAVGGHEALWELATGQRRFAGDDEQSAVTRALAYGQLDRWPEASELLRDAESRWRAGSPVTAMLGELTWSMAELWTGRTDRFEHSLATRRGWPPRTADRNWRHHVVAHMTAMLVIGDARRATRLLVEEELPEDALPLYCRSMLAAARGEAERAVDLARRSMVGAEGHGTEWCSAGMYASTVFMLVARGQLATARQLLDTCRATPLTLAHLLDIAEAQLDRALGDDECARTRLLRCATKTRLTVGMDILWSELVDIALRRGESAEAARGLAELARLPRSSRTTMLTLLARATVATDLVAARECERLARERAQPLEQAVVLERLVRHGGAKPQLLAEVYGLLGGLDAVLYRAWSRTLMRAHEVPVPDRTKTVAENERLLAMLAAGGLSNKQLAAALRTSEKSVEGRLSRLFNRTGYRSRIELSTAMRNGEYRSCS